MHYSGIRAFAHIASLILSNARALVDVSCDKDNTTLANSLSDLEVGYTIEVLWCAVNSAVTDKNVSYVLICVLHECTICFEYDAAETHV